MKAYLLTKDRRRRRQKKGFLKRILMYFHLICCTAKKMRHASGFRCNTSDAYRNCCGSQAGAEGAEKFFELFVGDFYVFSS